MTGAPLKKRYIILLLAAALAGCGSEKLSGNCSNQIEDLRDDPEFDAQLERLVACLRLAPLTAFRAEAGR